ncbi:MAG: AAA family ATPase, partial [Myxococcota bacterium]
MRLARLELYGFKSFPDRTTFHFGPGISCVVGPNGSGKSNVVDALKWCIGEQSARSLRGAEMTDVIFAGSTDRKPVGFAEVILTLATDEERPFSGDYAALREVQVGRRLHRTGASEYSINQTRVRRRDVIELLLDSGIGNDLYSFIEQGQVDKMISASPEDRRSLIDEAAGISRYKARRQEAAERLEATAAQLDRAADVVDEMARHLRALEGQVLKAAEFRRLGAVVRQHELVLALAKHLALSEERVAIRDEIAGLKDQEEAHRTEVARREEDLGQRRDELAVVEAGIVALRDQLAELDGAIREANATAQLHERRHHELIVERDRAAGEAEHQAERAEAATVDAEGARAEVAALEERGAGLEADASAAEAAAADADRVLVDARRARSEAEAAVQRALAARMSAETALTQAQRAHGERELRIASLEADRAERRADRVTAVHAHQSADKVR